MAIKTTLLAIFVLALTFKPSLAESFVECPGNPSEDTKAGDVNVNVDGVIFFTQTERVRLPDSGVFDTLITCVMVTDRSGTGQLPTKLNGGVGYTYVELELKSKLNEGLDYHIEVYREKSDTKKQQQ